MEHIFYEKIDNLYICLVEEIEEIGEAIENYKFHKIEKTVNITEELLQHVYDEIQDASIVLLSMFSTVRLKLKEVIKGEIIKGV